VQLPGRPLVAFPGFTAAFSPGVFQAFVCLPRRHPPTISRSLIWEFFMTALSPDMRKEQRWSSHIWATLALGLPLVGTQIAQIAIATTDVVMLGWYGTEELAATVLGLAGVFRRLYLSVSGFSSAILPLAAQAEGRNDPTHVRRSVRMGMWILLLFSVLVMPLLWFLEPVLIAPWPETRNCRSLPAITSG
jgi:O-antigen/teichoic acid export membrane protein